MRACGDYYISPRRVGTYCIRRHPVAGVIAPDETKGFPGAGQSIWSNSSRDDGALYDAQGQLVSYWRDE